MLAARLSLPIVLGVGAANALPPHLDAFGPCLAALRASRAARRITAETWQRHTVALTPDPRVLAELDAQPEVQLPVWDYFAILADDQRVEDGRLRQAAHDSVLDAIRTRYGVDPAILVAVWGIESDYGRSQGQFDVLRSLATLSCAGRRQRYFRREFLAALRIVQAGHVSVREFTGSWAGAFGQTQFMPGTFEWLAVDQDGDGRRDVVGSVGDALASTANYLRNAGWRPDRPWGFEVRVPRALAATGRGRRATRTLGEWAASGATRIDGSALVDAATPRTLTAGLLLPAGTDGPAFLVTRSFEALYRYNASERYALAVAHVADRLRGGGPLSAAWPTDDPGLSRADRRELQLLLRKRGHDVGSATAVYTAAIRQAVTIEQRRLALEPSGRAGQRLLATLREQDPSRFE
ncbi:MAG: lytic murein transglycosylase [Gemmatimonadaceae bacterium]